MMNEGCGINTDVGDEIIVGVEGAFTGVSINPAADPTGLMLLLAMIDNQYWPLHVCGDNGIGSKFNDIRNIGGNVRTVTTPIDPIDNPIEAYGCVLNCNYTISTDIQAECIVGKIDGKWQILRVRSTSFTGGVTSTSNGCRCCGMTPQNSKLFARILSVTPSLCGDYRACDEFVLRGINGNQCDPENPMRITVGCSAESGSELNDPADWLISVCGSPVEEIVSIDCCAPITSCNGVAYPGEFSEECICENSDSLSESSSESLSASDEASLSLCAAQGGSLCRLEVVVNTGPLEMCGGCSYRILIYSDPHDIDPCTSQADEIIDEVDAEACGIDDLEVCERVIIAKVPFRLPLNPDVSCPPVEWFIIRACSIKDCADPCEPPPPPPAPCCDILCEDQPLAVTATFEVMDCDCAPCTFSVELAKVDCLPGNERGNWRYDPETEIKCDTARNFMKLESIEYLCGSYEEDSASGSESNSDLIEQVGVLTVNGIQGVLIESTCVPFYAVFEVTFTCFEKFPGVVPPIPDLICRTRVTITE
jgi:hypothetical protein